MLLNYNIIKLLKIYFKGNNNISISKKIIKKFAYFIFLITTVKK
jgi:hypothetical protein